MSLALRMTQERVTLADKQTEKVWIGLHQDLGTTIRSIRESTPSDFNWRRKAWKSMSRRDLANRINARKIGGRPITEAIIARIENNKNVLEGHMLRIRQVLEGLQLELHLTKRK